MEKACFVEVSEKEYFLGFSLNKCTQVVQIEIIQMIRRVLILQLITRWRTGGSPRTLRPLDHDENLEKTKIIIAKRRNDLF